MTRPKVAVFSPNPYSLYSTAVCELLLRHGVDVAAVVVRRFTVKRFRSEARRDGTRLIRKIWNKLVLRERAYRTDDRDNIVSFRQAAGIKLRNVEELASTHGACVVGCDSLNDLVVERTLRSIGPDSVVFTGGGIIRRNILAVAGAGVLNCHQGILPEYRGMDVVEWAMLNEDWGRIGCTVHFMDSGLDTGDIVSTVHVDAIPGETIRRLRDRIEAEMPRAMVDAVVGQLRGDARREPQDVGAGKQHFVMHPALYAVAEAKLLNRPRPITDAPAAGAPRPTGGSREVLVNR